MSVTFLGLSGCYGHYIDGEKHGVPLPTVALRYSFSPQPAFKKAVFLDLVGYMTSADATVTDSGGTEASVSGTLEGGVARAGVEFAWVRGPAGKYEFGVALGVIHAVQHYDYMDGGVPRQEETGGTAPPYLVNDPSVFLRVKLGDRTRVRLGGHIGGGDYVIISTDAWLAADYAVNSNMTVTVGWRYMDVHTDDGPEGSTALNFRISGPTLGLVLAF